MKSLLSLLLIFSASMSHAVSLKDRAVTCIKDDLRLVLQGSEGWFSGGRIMLYKKSKLILSESMSEEMYEYNERLALYAPGLDERVYDLARIVSSAKKSIYGNDIRTQESESAVVHIFTDQHNPEFGGQTSAIFLRLNNGSSSAFEFNQDCKVTKGTWGLW